MTDSQDSTHLVVEIRLEISGSREQVLQAWANGVHDWCADHATAEQVVTRGTELSDEALIRNVLDRLQISSQIERIVDPLALAYTTVSVSSSVRA